MEVVNRHCAGLDVHKKTVVACRIVPHREGEWEKEIRTYGTTTGAVLELADWLRAGQVSQVAMESTGVYWRPVFNILEADFEVVLVNARRIKHVPGRKTDVRDAQWIADRQFYPASAPACRARTDTLSDKVAARTDTGSQSPAESAGRCQSEIGGCHQRRAGVSGRAMLQALIVGQDNPAQLAQMAHGRMRSKIAALEQALTGRVRDEHRFLLKLHLEHIDYLTERVTDLQQEIDRRIVPFDPGTGVDHNHLLDRLDTIPGVGLLTAQGLLAEIGTDMQRFPTAGHLASWAGLVPGKQESAGRNRSANTPKANRHLRTILVEAAHAAARSKDNYLAAQYRRLAARRGKKRAAIAVAHSILVIAYYLIQRGTAYVDLGAHYFDQRNQQATQRRLVKRLEQLGFSVSLQPLPQAA